MKKRKPLTLSWKAWVALIVAALLIIWLFDDIGRTDLARPTLYSGVVIVIAIVMNWELRSRLWFWAVMLAVTALHIALILYVSWPRGWIPAATVTPIVGAELAGIVTFVNFLEKQFEKSTRSRSVPVRPR